MAYNPLDTYQNWQGQGIDNDKLQKILAEAGKQGGFNAEQMKGAQQNAAEMYKGAEGAHQQDKANKDAQDAAKAAADKQSAYAQSLSDQADQFHKGMGSYIGGQVDNAQNVARGKLQGDLQQNKEDASKRGLLYSGVKAGTDASAKSYQSGQLASQIQGINNEANSQADAKDKMAGAARSGADASQLSNTQNQISQNQSTYQQALQQQQNQNNFWQSLLGGVGKVGGAIAGLL